VAVECPSVGRTLLIGGRPTYLRFPPHLFVFKLSNKNQLIVKGLHYLHLFIKKNFKYYITPLPNTTYMGAVCLDHQTHTGKNPLKLIEKIIAQYWLFRFANAPFNGLQAKAALKNWERESKETDSCSCHLFAESNWIKKLEIVSEEELLKFLKS